MYIMKKWKNKYNGKFQAVKTCSFTTQSQQRAVLVTHKNEENLLEASHCVVSPQSNYLNVIVTKIICGFSGSGKCLDQPIERQTQLWLSHSCAEYS